MNAISINPNVLHEDDLATIDEVYAATPEDQARKSLSARFRDLSLFGKLRSVFGVFLALILVLSMVAAAGLYSIYGQYQHFANVNAGAVASADLVGHTGEMRYHSLRYIFAGEDAAVERLLESQGEAANDLDAIEARITAHGADYAASVAELRSQQDLYRNTFDRLRYSLKTDGRNAETTAIAYELSTAGDTLFQQARSLETRLLSEAAQIEADGLAQFYRFVVFGALLVAATLLTIVLGLRFLSGDLTAKLREIVNAMNRLSKGDADFELEGKERADEIGEMVRAIQVFQIANHRLIKYSAERAERAQAELEERERAREEQQRLLIGLADQFEKTVGDVVSGVAAASSQLQTTATNMAGTAEEATRQTAEVSNSMEEANRGATAAASASDEFAMSIGEISRQAASSAELARRATTSATEADETISALSDSAVQVGQIVELIQTIAQRTNLLALNASIEAARGGEAGRGFAVVASEVKELAMQTSRATEQVAEQIRAMQDTTGASVSALRSIAEQVQQLETTAVSIASAVDQQSVAGQDLARSIDLAARSTDRVSSHIAEVRELSLSTGAAASQVLSSATDLEEQASTLRGQVQGFLAKIRSA